MTLLTDPLDARPTISLDEARLVIAAAIRAAQDLGCCETIAVVDAVGDEVAVARMDGAWRDAAEIALAKAFTACTFDIDTARLAEDDHPAQRLFDRPAAEWTIYAGGMPLHRRARVIGAVGVAGGDAAQDRLCADSAARSWREEDR